MTATKDDLGALHRLVTKAFVHEIETCLNDEIMVTPALLTGAAKFLKDNEITADPADKQDLRSLQERLKEAGAGRAERRSNILKLVNEE